MVDNKEDGVMEKTFTPKTQMSFAACLALQRIEDADLRLHELRCSITSEQYRQSIEVEFENFQQSIMADAVMHRFDVEVGKFLIDEERTGAHQGGCMEVLELMRNGALECNLYMKNADERHEFFNVFRHSVRADIEQFSPDFHNDSKLGEAFLSDINRGSGFKLETIDKCERHISKTANLYDPIREKINTASVERCRALRELKEVVAKIDAAEEGQLFTLNAA